MKKVLIYNWSHVDDMIGGGVTVYIQNLINALIQSGEYKVTFLNSGWTYDKSGKTYIKKVNNQFNPLLECYEIVNSPVLAPIEQCAENLRIYLNDKTMLPIINGFIKEQNGFDVIHFNNLEGISLDVLRLKEKYPDIKVIYSMHNYFPFCSRVNLWQDGITDHPHNCNKTSYDECVNCYKRNAYFTTVAKRRKMNLVTRAFSRIVNTVYQDKGRGELYKAFTEENVRQINKYADLVLAVSERVAEIAYRYGIDKEKVRVSYIGTKVAESARYSRNATYDGNTFKIMYMGYMRPDKGYYFLIDCLDVLPEKYAEKIDVSIVARYDEKKNREELAKLEEFKDKYKNITLINGYTPKNQKDLLQGIHLGIVPVLWEDNLPQVGIEQIAYGVPILVSDLGGVKELCRDSRFVFRAGDADDFIKKLTAIMDNPEYLEEYWGKVMRLRTLEDHFREIKNHYN